MDATLTLVDLAGAIALLIWGVHMVQTGITRAFGPQLRRILGYALGNRFKAFLAGLGVTAILQSSTATGLMVTAFAAGGLVDLVPALAVMLGANVGTTLIVQVLSFDVSRVSFLFILIGVFMFRRSVVTRTRDLGRVGIGLGLMLIALQHLLSMITPYEDVPSLRMLLGAITTDPLIDIVLAAGLTWAAHSSVAVVLLIMAFAMQGVVPPHAAFALVLGANLGTRVITINWGSFDTHGNQIAQQDPQLVTMSRSLSAFLSDLKTRGIDDRVAVLVFSEFGRRVAENASAGTDHGAGGLMMLAGTGVNGGLAGQFPGLSSLDQTGDLLVPTDFRSVFAETISGWLGGSFLRKSVSLLSTGHELLPNLGDARDQAAAA